MANDIAKIDKNLAVNTTAITDIVWYSAVDPKFSLTGLYTPALAENPPKYQRMPEAVAKATSEGVYGLYRNTAGAKLRFVTDSRRIAVKVKWGSRTVFAHMPFTGVCGFDLYAGEGADLHYVKTFVPPADTKAEGYESEYAFPQAEKRAVQINFPLYNTVEELYIGLDEGAVILPSAPFESELPIVYYGSSITQGGCASKPSSSYQAILSRWLGIDHVNLGFSGNAKGETVMAEYIASLPMCAFVLDYEHNAPSVEHLEATHYPFFKIIRDKNPNLPIICVSAPGKRTGPVRRAIVRATVERAVADGDSNVYFVDGSEFYPPDAADNCTVDGTHPNDLGFYFMAKKLLPVIKEALGQGK